MSREWCKRACEIKQGNKRRRGRWNHNEKTTWRDVSKDIWTNVSKSV